MSFDISSGPRHCDHMQILERYAVNPFDFRTLRLLSDTQFNMRAPINGADLVRLWVRGVLVRPTDPVYGYAIVPDPQRIQTGYPFQKIVFQQPVRELTPLIEVSYLTHGAFCLKCGGTGEVADWSISPAGGLNRVVRTRKLAQASLKYILTSRNPFNPNLTSPIKNYLGQKFGLTITDQDVSAAVSRALTSYQAIQKAQSTVQTMDPAEMIQSVLSVSANQDPSDPTVVNVSIALSAYGSTEAIPLNVSFRTT